MTFRVAAIPTEVAQSVRETLKSPKYGFPAHREVASGRAPCRHCLRLIEVHQEELLLFTYDPFQVHGVPALPGPVYIHAANCERHDGNTTLASLASVAGPFTLNAYGADRKLLEEVRVTNGENDAVAKRMFENPLVEYVHVRSTGAGCYLFGLERN